VGVDQSCFKLSSGPRNLERVFTSALYTSLFDRTHPSRRYTVSLYNQGVLNKGLESFEQLLLESGESLVACLLRRLLLGAL
jgi:hypothetical protein